MKNISKIAKTVSKIFEILFLFGAIMMIVSIICSFAIPQKYGSFLLNSVENGLIATNGFEINIADKDGNLIPAAVSFFSFAGLFSMLAFTMIFRNIYLIIQTTEGKTKFSKGKTTFQKDNIRMVREIGIFSIWIPVMEFIISLLAKLVIGADLVETSVQIYGIVMGIAVLFLSQIFTYGENLEKEVEGLI